MINHNFANKNAKNNKTRRKLVSTPSYHVQTLNTNKKRNKKSKKAPQTPNKPAATHLGRKHNTELTTGIAQKQTKTNSKPNKQ